MVVQANILTRNQSDALAKLCIRHSARLTRAIKTMKLNGQENLQVRLVLYYIDRGMSWDRESEKQDWKDHNLASLKYNTFKFVIQLIAQSGDSRNSDLYSEVNEIATAVGLGAYTHGLELCRSTLQIAWQREEYSLAIHVLEFMEEILENLEPSEYTKTALDEVSKLQEEGLRRLGEVQRSIEIRRTVIDPIREEWVELESPPYDKVDVLQKAASILNATDLHSPYARIVSYALHILLSLLEGETLEAETYTNKLLMEYDSNPILKQRYTRRYILHLRSAIQMYLQISAFDVAKRLLKVLAGAAVRYPDFEIQAKSAWIYSALRFSLHCDDKPFFSKTLAAFKEFESESLNQIEEKEQMRVYWALMLNHIEWGQLELAMKAGAKLLSRKPTVRKTVVMNARIAIFACEVALFPSDEDRVLGSYKATYQFIDRNRDKYPKAFDLIRVFKRIWQAWRSNEVDAFLEAEVSTFAGPLHDFSKLLTVVRNTIKAHQQSQ